jgi:hypothetical protein
MRGTSQNSNFFSNKNHKYKPIGAASLCACSALPFLEATVEIDGDIYCEGTLIDTANFKTLLEDHPDLDEIWVIRVRDATRFFKPLNLHDAMGNLFQKFEAALAENDVKLFKYHVKHEGRWHGRIAEMHVHSDVNLEWSHSNLDIGVREGQLAASELKLARSFFFTLEGESAHGDEALWNTTFDLVFNYAVPPRDVLAELKGKKFEALAEGDVELGTDIVPKGLTLTDGIARRIVAFKDGKMVGERPRFRLQAPSTSTGAQSNKRGVYVFFSRERAQLYSHFFPIQLVEQFSTELRENPVVDLDLHEVGRSRPEPRDATVSISDDGGNWRVHWDIAGFQTPSRLTKLQAASLWAELGKRQELETFEVQNSESANSIRLCMQKAMTAGSTLYKLLRRDPVFAKALRQIEKLPYGSKIAFTTEGMVFPWELLYPEHYDHGDGIYDPNLFWGRRFQIESLLFPDTEDEKFPEQRQQRGKLFVSMGVNEAIDRDWKHKNPSFLPIDFHEKYCTASLGEHRGKCLKRYNEIRAMFIEQHVGSLIYFFCHGNDDELKFDDVNEPLRPNSVNVGRGPYPGWPIIFLNACKAGDVSPLSFLSFRTEFRKKGAAGLLAPSFPIPTLFAAVFAKHVLDQYELRRPIGEILLDLRGDLLARGNPLGLWYSLQCPLDVRAPAD